MSLVVLRHAMLHVELYKFQYMCSYNILVILATNLICRKKLTVIFYNEKQITGYFIAMQINFILSLLMCHYICNSTECHSNLYIDGHKSKPANSNFSNFFYLINSKVIPFYIMC